MSDRVYIDIETFSEVDLKKEGMHRYAQDPSTMILCIAWGMRGGEVEIWSEEDPAPTALIDLINDHSKVFAAHNAQFELTMINGLPGQKLGLPPISPDRWIDTAAKAAALSLPRSLKGAAQALRLPQQKDTDGHNIMIRLSKPRARTDKNPETRWTPDTKPTEFDQLYQYCAQDVRTLIALDAAMPDLRARERYLWFLDTLINERGFAVDVPTIEQVQDWRERILHDLEEECQRITGGISSSQRAGILGFLEEEGLYLAGYTKEDISTALADEISSDKARRVLEIRQEAGKISTKKYDSLRRSVCDDGRFRGGFLFHGASTGRWSGRIFQPHNLAKGGGFNVDNALKALTNGDYAVFRLMYDQPMDVLAGCIRGMIIAPPGKELVVCDFSSIEAIMVQWLAGDEDALNVFRSGRDVYKVMAAAIFDVPYDQVDKKQRFVGKIAVLGLGYAMGADKFYDTCHSWGADYVDNELAQRTVQVFREKYARLKNFWYKMQEMAAAAIRKPYSTFKVNDRISFVFEKPWLFMILPSGRRLTYPHPTVNREKIKWSGGEFETDVIRYHGIDTVTRRYAETTTYGGKLVENATQAVARDLLSEAIIRLERMGQEVVMHVHDEIVVEAPIGALTPEKLEEIMCTLPPWAEGAPVKGEAFTCQRYRK